MAWKPLKSVKLQFKVTVNKNIKKRCTDYRTALFCVSLVFYLMLATKESPDYECQAEDADGNAGYSNQLTHRFLKYSRIFSD